MKTTSRRMRSRRMRSLFDTKQTEHNVMRSPFARDVVKELAAACRKEGQQTFPAVTDRILRLNMLNAPGGPAIEEFEILK